MSDDTNPQPADPIATLEAAAVGLAATEAGALTDKVAPGAGPLVEALVEHMAPAAISALQSWVRREIALFSRGHDEASRTVVNP